MVGPPYGDGNGRAVVFWVVVVVLGVLTPGYNPVMEFISTLGAVGASYAAVQRLNFVLLGISLIAFAVGLHRWNGASRRPGMGTLLMALSGLGVVGAGLFQSDPAAPNSTTNLVHDATTGLSLLAGIAGVTLISRRLDRDSRWPRHPFATSATVVTLLVSATLFFAAIDTVWVGLAQRLFVGVLTGWTSYHAYRFFWFLRDWHPISE